MNRFSNIGTCIRTRASGRGSRWVAGALTALALAAGASSALAGANGMHAARMPDAEQQRHIAPVLPPQARPFGYSLQDMARLTAVFNAGDHSGPPPNSPFQILYVNWVTGGTSFEVARGTFFYVPLAYSNDAPPVIGNFPANPEDPHQAVHYWLSQAQVGVASMEVVVDGKAVSLGGRNVVGVRADQLLPDGSTQFVGAAAFIAPLPRGAHTVEIRMRATGDALRAPAVAPYFPDGVWEFSIVYNVNVR